ncbi:alpha-methylacyl-CoA racemase [Phlebotomus argentipes]|uniref:alpha-methylacyl-CoA racemase n=1 Tax=Phlebotomus argentipes TaxID=94469 RepID=UPI0028934560|nr:alpha-methylacyl-CoA racemase [Phlebotomus argentipes]
MALKGVKVLEFVGLAPAPFCGMILSDFGATITRIDKTPQNSLDTLKNGKRNIALNLKHQEGRNIVRDLCKKSDVLIEPYRPGIMEKLGLGPDILMKDNPRLIYARLTGFGQSGPLAQRAGHDINYVAMSGVLSFLGRKSEKPTAPINLLADFAGGGLLCAFGILAALLARQNTGRGQIVDTSMVEGAAYVASFLTRSQTLPIWGKDRGENMLDTGAFFYDTYETKDGKFMSVGCLEHQFFETMVKTLGLEGKLTQFDDNEKGRKILEETFRGRTQKEWSEMFEKTDSCVFPVLHWTEAPDHAHNKVRGAFVNKNDTEEVIVPNPAPKLSDTPGLSSVLSDSKDEWQNIQEILGEIDYDVEKMKLLVENGVVLTTKKGKL